ncbi:MAG: EF-hand domain-containing protein [Verrucomicrobiaceae bacterium]|nr:EF-hand domain-containing protein [Verrucomicrobiaceae bacterium]
MKPALLLLLATAASAQTAADLAFQKYDADQDGKVTASELPQESVFKRFDLNSDGHITLEETRSVMGGSETSSSMPTDLNQGRKLWQRLDKNKDGKLTRDEVPQSTVFARFDLNNDGVITQEEGKQVVQNAIKPSDAGTPARSASSTPVVTSGPKVLKGTEHGIGRQIADVTFTDLAGATHQLSDFQSAVIAMTSATCPVSKKYLHSLAKLEKDLREQNIALLLVNPFASETADEIKAQLTEAKITATYCHDQEKAFASALDAQTTTEVFLLDSKRTLIYRGALDDRYGIDYSHDAPRSTYLRDAIAAMLAGRQPIIAATAAPGCELDLPSKNLTQTSITYHRDVARILQQNCVTCHRENGIAPFALDDLAEVTDRAKVIKRVITEGTMPPWFAAPVAEGKDNPWANDCSLSTRDKTDLITWLESANRPLGDPADAPAPLVFEDEWTIGKPDLIVQLPRPVSIKADGYMPYQFLTAQTTLTEDKWVSGYEIVPTDRTVVHHVIVNVHTKGGKVRDRDEGSGGYWAAYVPGNASQVYPAGFARKLPAGSTVSFQIHYTPSGKATQDQLRMGLVFAKEPPRYIVETIGVPKRKLSIPPGEANHLETHLQTVPSDLNVMAYMAHMHVRGKTFKYELITADGTETLLDIPRYDFNWQLRYDLAQPKVLPRGSQLKISAHFDNSPANQANPDPTQTVKWGSQTYDEMMIGYLETFRPVSNTGAE